MSGEKPEGLAELLNAIAGRLEAGHALRKDAQALRSIARQAAGIDQGWTLKAHRGPGQPRRGAEGVMFRFAVATEIKHHRDEHHCTLAKTYADLERQRGGEWNLGAHSLKAIWQEMRPILEMEPSRQKAALQQACFNAEGLRVIVTGAEG